MPTRRAVMLDQDVSAHVISYGSVEQIKSSLFKTSQVFNPEFSLVLDNSKGYFTPGGERSMLGKNHYNTGVSIYRNGVVAFEGSIRGVDLENTDKVSKIRVGNNMSKLSDARAVVEETGVNPAQAIFGALSSYGFGDLLDVGSFEAAAGAARAAGAVIDLNFTDDLGSTLTEIITAIADSCSLVVFAEGNIIRCQAFAQYQGSSAGMRRTITESNARGFGELTYDDSAFANRVEVNYGAAEKLTLDDVVSQARERVVRSTGIDGTNGSAVAISDLDSASYFGTILLQRSAYRRLKLEVTLGPEFDTIKIGHRHPVTNEALGLDAEPMEAIEVRKSLTTDDIGVVFVSLS